MRHFSLKAMLVAMAMMALWFSTFNGYRGAPDVRALILTALVIMSVAAALFHTGRHRAFWVGFAGTLLILGTRQLFNGFGARFDWAQRLSVSWGQAFAGPGSGDFVLGIHQTLVYGTVLLGAFLIGLLCVLVHDSATKEVRRVEPPDTRR